VIAIPELFAAADDNFSLHVSYVPSHVARMRVIADESLTLVDSGLRDDTFNIICRARLSESDAKPRIARAIKHFRDAGRPFSWWVSPADRPRDLPDRLTKAGLGPAETHVAMAADLTVLTAEFSLPAGFRLERVRTPEQVREFSGAGANPLLDSTDANFFTAATPALLAANCPVWLYVGYVDDTPVATSELTLSGSAARGVAGIYNVSTRLAFRKRGIGTAMTLRPLLDARAAGYRIAVLQASEEGKRVYARLGFQPIGEIQEYKLRT
jgi:ribosomal protein S18 acetylase RimI-like enzyme